jgi:hypothetical protein
MCIPLRFQLAPVPSATPDPPPEHAAETLDVSSRGVCMKTDAPPHVGSIVEIRLRLPEMIMGLRVPEWRITGHVVHVEGGAASGAGPGQYGVGVQFHYYETVAPMRNRLRRSECDPPRSAAGSPWMRR